VRYRYRTAVLVGPWRARAEEAQSDAVRACQAYQDDAEGFRWTVEGRIEVGSPPIGADEHPSDRLRL
jgi:hypothetical protein